MTSTTVVTQGPAPEEDFGLNAVAQHNAAVASTEQFPEYQDNAKGLGIFEDGYTPYSKDASYLHNPPTPRSNTASDGIRTRSGRSTRRTDSPFSTVTGNRVSKSPAVKSKKDRKSKLDKSKTPKLTAPLSVLTKDSAVPMKDMDEWVHRPADVRRKEVEKRNGYVTRPMNSFMLYRSAYAERTKAWCVQNNHQVVSSVSGESWPMEPQEVRDQFNEWAKIERANHAAAHPEYKFSPSKSTKRRKGEVSDDEDDISELDHDPDGEYRAGGGRNTRQRRQAQQQPEVLPLNETYGFSSNPYYQQSSGYEQSQYQYQNPGRPVPSNIAFDQNNQPFDPRTGMYIQQTTYQNPQYQSYVQDVHGVRVQTPVSLSGMPQQSVGGYGLPGGHQMAADELFDPSRAGTPMQQYNQYGQQPIYPQYPSNIPQQQYQQYSQPMSTQQQMSAQQAAAEHRAHLFSQAQPQEAIDPSLAEAMMQGGAVGGQGENHFESAIGDLTGMDYYHEPTSADGTMPWSPTEMLK